MAHVKGDDYRNHRTDLRDRLQPIVPDLERHNKRPSTLSTQECLGGTRIPHILFDLRPPNSDNPLDILQTLPLY